MPKPARIRSHLTASDLRQEHLAQVSEPSQGVEEISRNHSSMSLLHPQLLQHLRRQGIFPFLQRLNQLPWFDCCAQTGLLFWGLRQWRQMLFCLIIVLSNFYCSVQLFRKLNRQLLRQFRNNSRTVGIELFFADFSIDKFSNAPEQESSFTDHKDSRSFLCFIYEFFYIPEKAFREFLNVGH